MDSETPDASDIENTIARERLMLTRESIERFQDAMKSLKGRKDSTALRALLHGFDDSSEHQEILDGLVSVVEAFPLDVYVATLVGELASVHSRAPLFLLRLHVRLLRNPVYVEGYGRALATTSDGSRQMAATVLKEVIADEYSDERDIAQARQLLRLLREPS